MLSLQMHLIPPYMLGISDLPPETVSFLSNLPYSLSKGVTADRQEANAESAYSPCRIGIFSLHWRAKRKKDRYLCFVKFSVI